MAKRRGSRKTSRKIARVASGLLRNKRTPLGVKRVAASALAQAGGR